MGIFHFVILLFIVWFTCTHAHIHIRDTVIHACSFGGRISIFVRCVSIFNYTTVWGRNWKLPLSFSTLSLCLSLPLSLSLCVSIFCFMRMKPCMFSFRFNFVRLICVCIHYISIKGMRTNMYVRVCVLALCSLSPTNHSARYTIFISDKQIFVIPILWAVRATQNIYLFLIYCVVIKWITAEDNQCDSLTQIDESMGKRRHNIKTIFRGLCILFDDVAYLVKVLCFIFHLPIYAIMPVYI